MGLSGTAYGAAAAPNRSLLDVRVRLRVVEYTISGNQGSAHDQAQGLDYVIASFGVLVRRVLRFKLRIAGLLDRRAARLGCHWDLSPAASGMSWMWSLRTHAGLARAAPDGVVHGVQFCIRGPRSVV